jgi:hypothetical protein
LLCAGKRCNPECASKCSTPQTHSYVHFHWPFRTFLRSVRKPRDSAARVELACCADLPLLGWLHRRKRFPLNNYFIQRDYTL